MKKIKEFFNTKIKNGKKLFIIGSIIFLILMSIFIINKFYTKKTICESYPYLSVVHNGSEFENGSIPLNKFYSNFTIPKGESFCIGKVENRSVTDKVYNFTYEEPYCNGKILTSGKTYKVFCSNEENRSVTSCSVLLNCTDVRKWKIK